MRTKLVWKSPWLAILLLVQACGGATNSGTGSGGASASGSGGGSASGSGGAGGSASDSGGAGGSASGSGGAGGSVSDCDPALVDLITKQTGIVGSCTTTVRLDFLSLTPIGYSIVCGPYKPTTEAMALALAETDATSDCVGPLISGPSPTDEFVFFKSAGDFGGSSAVSVRNGLTVFGGTTVWSGTGDITYPTTWQDPASLGFGCSSTNIPLPPMRAFHLGGGQPYQGPEAKIALEKVWNSALPIGLANGGYIFDAMVLLYPRTVGALNPATAEWIVLVNSGWLE